MKFGRLFFALSLFCSVAMIGLTFFHFENLFPNVSYDVMYIMELLYEANTEQNLINGGSEAFLIFMIAYAAALAFPAFIKLIEALICKRSLGAFSMFLDVIFAICAACILIKLRMDGVEIDTLNIWAIEMTVLPILSFIFNSKGRKQHRRDYYRSVVGF